METAAGLISAIVKFSSRMQRGEHQPLGADAFLMHPHRNASAVVADGGGSVRLQSYPDGITEARQMLVHGIVHDLIYKMVKSPG